MSAAISLVDLEIGYTAGRKVTSITVIPELVLAKGKLTCLLGANGIGKSTLLRTITGSLVPLAGRVLIDDEPINSISVKDKAQKIAVVLTDPAHLGFTTVYEMIALGRNPYTNWMNTFTDRDKAAVEKALIAIGMLELADKPLIELSDGNLQKVIIGRAIAQDTDIIILDEPTIHLDVNNKIAIVELLRKLSVEHRKTILFSTHDLELAKQYSDRLWIYDIKGVSDGLTEDLLLDGTVASIFQSINNMQSSSQVDLKINGNEEYVHLVRQGLAKAGIEEKLASTEIWIEENAGNIKYRTDAGQFNSIAHLIKHYTTSTE